MMDHVNSPFKADRFFNFPQSSERPDEVDDLAVINSILSDFDAPPSATVLQADAAIATSTHQPADRAFGSFESGGLEFVGDSGTRDPFGGQYLTQVPSFPLPFPSSHATWQCLCVNWFRPSSGAWEYCPS